MTKKKEPRFKRVIPPLIFLLLILAIAGLSMKYLVGDPGPEIIQKVIELRQEDNTVKKADLIAATDDLVVALNNRNVDAEWESLTECLSATCSNADYLNLVQTVAYEERIPNYDLIINLVLTYKYWTGEDVLKFSKALTEVDKGIDALNVRVVTDAWKKIVECDGKCPEKADLYFELIQEIVDLS